MLYIVLENIKFLTHLFNSSRSPHSFHCAKNMRGQKYKKKSFSIEWQKWTRVYVCVFNIRKCSVKLTKTLYTYIHTYMAVMWWWEQQQKIQKDIIG